MRQRSNFLAFRAAAWAWRVPLEAGSLTACGSQPRCLKQAKTTLAQRGCHEQLTQKEVIFHEQ